MVSPSHSRATAPITAACAAVTTAAPLGPTFSTTTSTRDPAARGVGAAFFGRKPLVPWKGREGGRGEGVREGCTVVQWCPLQCSYAKAWRPVQAQTTSGKSMQEWIPAAGGRQKRHQQPADPTRAALSSSRYRLHGQIGLVSKQVPVTWLDRPCLPAGTSYSL